MRTRTLVALLALTLACGQKAPPVPPQLVRPEPVAELGAMATPEGVRLSWGRPDHYTSGKRMNDLGGFTIERAPAEGGEFARVGTVEVTDRTRFRKEHRFTWTDGTATVGARYRYRVIAFTTDGYHSAPAGPVSVQYGKPPGD
jgi:hypothetical protein